MSEPIQQEAPAELEVMRLKQERALTEFGGGPFSSAAATAHYFKVAELFSQSVFVPDAFRGKPGDCLIALDLARSMDEPPLRVMQNIYTVKGRPAFYSQFMIARANRLAGYQSSIHWRTETLEPPFLDAAGREKKDGPLIKYRLPNLRVTAYAKDRYGEEISASVDSSMAVAEGWTDNLKYRSMPQHMFQWRSAAFLVRLYNPEVMNGFPTAEEVQDVQFTERQQRQLAPGESKTQRLVDRILAPQRAAEEEPQGEAPLDVPEVQAEGVAQEVVSYLTPPEIDALAKRAKAAGLVFAQIVEDVTSEDPEDAGEDPLGWAIPRWAEEQISQRLPR